MSWLEGSPKRTLGRSNDIPGPSARAGWGSTLPSATRTYGSSHRKSSASVRNNSASRGLFGVRSKSVASSATVGLSPMHEEMASTPKLSPVMGSLRGELPLTNRDLRLELGSPEESPPRIASRTTATKAGKGTKSTAAASGGRSRRGPSRARTVASDGSSALSTKGPTKDPAAARVEGSKRRGTGARKHRSAANAPTSTTDVVNCGEIVGLTFSGSTVQLSPSKRRDRSPERRGCGKPDLERGDLSVPNKKPATSSCPLRQITNHSSGSERGYPRTNVKTVSASRTESSRDSDEETSGEEEWRDDFDFSKPVSKKAQSKARAHDEGLPYFQVDQQDGHDTPQRDLEARMEALDASPCLALTPSRSPPRAACESSFSLDSSMEGILVGDKRRRGNGRGKRAARGTEDHAHRSSRSRHLSPMIPVTGGSRIPARVLGEERILRAGIVDIRSHTVVDHANDCTETSDSLCGSSGADNDDNQLFADLETSPRASAPPKPGFQLRRAVSTGDFDATNALSTTHSPRNVSKILSRHEDENVDFTAALHDSTAVRDLEELGGSPPRLARSMSLSQASAWSSSGGSGRGSGCSKVMRAASRRRSRASSTSSPLPMLVTSPRVLAGGVGESASATGGGSSGGRRVSGTTSVGGARRRRSSVMSVDGLQRCGPIDVGMATARGHSSSAWKQPLRRERPTSLPSGLSLAGLGILGREARGEPDEICASGDPGVGWVLRAPIGSHMRHRSQSFVSGRHGFMDDALQPKSMSGLTVGSSSTGSLSSSSQEHRIDHNSEIPFSRAVAGGTLESSPQRTQAASARTPKASSSRLTSAAMHRSNNLSSVARRMDRLEIRASNVDTQAAQAQKAILESPSQQHLIGSSMIPMGTANENAVLASGAALRGTVEGALEASPLATKGQMSTPVCHVPISLPLNLTPGKPSNDRLSMGSIAACSPAACLRDYLSGAQRRRGEHPLEEEDKGAMSKGSTPTTVCAPGTASPLDTICTRSAALGSPSPPVAGLFGNSRKGHAGAKASRLPPDENDISSPVKDSRASRNSRHPGLMASRGTNEVVAIRACPPASPPKPRKGNKLATGLRARSVPLGVNDRAAGASAHSRLPDFAEDGPEGGFVIRRKSMIHAWSSSPGWKPECTQDPELALSPPNSLRRSSVHLGGPGFRGNPELLSPARPPQDREARRRRTLSSPLPLAATDECDTPAAFLGGATTTLEIRDTYEDLVKTTKFDTSDCGERATAVSSADPLGRSEVSGDIDGVAPSRGCQSRSPVEEDAVAGVVAIAPAVCENNPRRCSTESVGPTTGGTASRSQFETPQPETKFKWGSRPQYGDWGISQPASARTLRRLAGRLMAFAGRATGGRFNMGTPDREQPIGTDGSPEKTPQRPSNTTASSAADATTLEDVRPARHSPMSSRSCSLRPSFGFRNSLGTLLERGESGTITLTPRNEGDMRASKHLKEIEKGHGIGPMGADMDAVNSSMTMGWGREPEGHIGESCGEVELVAGGRSRFSGATQMGRLREAQRRRQKKAKMRRVSMSIKSRLSSGTSLGTVSIGGANSKHVAGLNSVKVIEAESAGVGISSGHSHHFPDHVRASTDGNCVDARERQTVRGFMGVNKVIAQGEEHESDDEDSCKAQATPAPTHGPVRLGRSPMSTRMHLGAGEVRVRLMDERKETPVKVREDLERSLTELHNLSISLCTSESDDSPVKQACVSNKSFMLNLEDDQHQVALDPTVDADGDSMLDALRLNEVMAKALCMLSVDELLGEVPVVSQAWRKAAILAFAEVASGAAEDQESSRSVARGLEENLSSFENPKRGQAQLLRAKSSAPGVDSSRHEWAPEKLVNVFPWGGFLSEGSFKQVYKVWNAVQSRMEALSVMDRDLVAASGNTEVVSQELRVGILASSLVQRGVCPNFVQTFGLFRSGEAPPAEIFGSGELKYPCGRSPGAIRSQTRTTFSRQRALSQREGGLRYQFIGMELCEHGDAEGLIRAQPEALLPLDDAMACLFQMAFALYAGRTELTLRHADVKLLNFLVGNAASLAKASAEGGHHMSTSLSSPSSAKGGVSKPGRRGRGRATESKRGNADGCDVENGEVILRYGVDRDVVELRMPKDRAFVVKLADFGTADVNPATLGECVGAGHFTTLENTPIEHLCCGQDAQQTYAGDTFSLALATIHLFTGGAPYEEIMGEVECPDDLYDALANTWSDHPQYGVVCDIVLDGAMDEEGGVGDQQDEDDDQDATLMNTFYRYMVLFGVPKREILEDAFGADNPIWNAVGNLLGWRVGKAREAGGRGGRRTGGMSAASKRFCRRLHEDQARFSLHHGTNPLIARGRARLEAVPGAFDAVTSMANFDPSRRPTMLEVLRHEVFSGLRLGRRNRTEGRDGRRRTVLEFMAYARQDGEEPLPDL